MDKGYKEQYGKGNSLVSEQVVKAVTARLVSIYNDQDQRKGLMEYDKSQNFVAVKPLYYCLKNKYENNRGKYQSFNKFMPEIVDTLEKI